MIDVSNIRDDLYKKINSITGKVDMKISNKISELLEERIDLADMISSALSSNVLIKTSRVDVQSNPAFPTVFFEVANRNQRQLGSSAIIVKTDGSLKLNLNSESEHRDILIKHIQNLMQSEQIKRKIDSINIIAQELDQELEDR